MWNNATISLIFLFWKSFHKNAIMLPSNRLIISIFKWINQFFKFSVLICITVHTDIPHIGIFNNFQEYKVSLQLKSLLALEILWTDTRLELNCVSSERDTPSSLPVYAAVVSRKKKKSLNWILKTK